MRLAVVQTDPVFGEKERNIDAALAQMALTSADMYVLPELFATGYNFVSAAEAAVHAEAFNAGVTFDAMRAFAAECGAVVVFGFPENDNGTLYNASALIRPDGTSALYRKIHLFDREQLLFAPGNLGFAVHDTAFGAVGMMICFDWYFPEAARTLAIKGARIIAHPSNLVLPNCPNAMPVRSLENRVFAATSNRIGTEDRGGSSLTFIGQSQITSQRGDILCRCPADAAETRSAEIDPALADNKFATERNHLLRDRRPEFYA